jgi:hypothetical protein
MVATKGMLRREPSDGEALDPFDDDTPLDVACDLENPESCESCQ